MASLSSSSWALFYRLNIFPYVVSEGNARWLGAILLPCVTCFLSIYFKALRGERRRTVFEFLPLLANVLLTTAWFSVLHINGEGINMATVATVGDRKGAAQGVNGLFVSNLLRSLLRAAIFCGLFDLLGSLLLRMWSNSAKQRPGKSVEDPSAKNRKHGATNSYSYSPVLALGFRQRLILALAHLLASLVCHPLTIQFILATSTFVRPIAKRREAFVSPAFILAAKHSEANRTTTTAGVSADGSSATEKDGAVDHNDDGRSPLERGEFLLDRYISRPKWGLFSTRESYFKAAVPGVFLFDLNGDDRDGDDQAETSQQQNPNLQQLPPSPPNIVIVFAEGLDRFSSNSNGATGFPGLMPNLKKLEAESLSFTNLAVPFGTGWSLAGKTSLLCSHPYTMPRQQDIDAVFPALLKEEHHWALEDEKLLRRDMDEDHDKAVKNGSWVAGAGATRTPYPTPVPSFLPRPAPRVPESWFHRSFSDVVASYIPGSTCVGDILASTAFPSSSSYYGELVTGCTVGFAGVGRLFQDHGFQAYVDKSVNCPSQDVWPPDSKPAVGGWGYTDSDLFRAASSRINTLKRARKGELPFASGVDGSGGGLNFSFNLKGYNRLLGGETPPAVAFSSNTHPLTKSIYPAKGRPFIVVMETGDTHDGDWSAVCEKQGLDLLDFAEADLLKEGEKKGGETGLSSASSSSGGALRTAGKTNFENSNYSTAVASSTNDKPSALKQALELSSWGDAAIVKAIRCFDRLVTDFARAVADGDTVVLIVGDHHPHNALQKELSAAHVKRWLDENGGPAPVFPSTAVNQRGESKAGGDDGERHYGHALKPTLFAALYAPGRVVPGQMITRPGTLMDLGPTLLQLAGIEFDESQGRGMGFGRSLIAPVRGPQDMTLRELMALPPQQSPSASSADQPCLKRERERRMRQADPRLREGTAAGPQASQEHHLPLSPSPFAAEWCAEEQYEELERELEAFCFDERVKQMLWQPRLLEERELRLMAALDQSKERQGNTKNKERQNSKKGKTGAQLRSEDLFFG